ncbi:hypothetical protein QFC24_000286 [Naganishia onofrii]|uniref:Uncharacterized protein n=1 Tax=Naganishia onofrii TaxID=1851511 RepID=A0ACC2XWU4_9TREE|nr:hypothetical protein QFC24_000286 [Naganishia onofrii]
MALEHYPHIGSRSQGEVGFSDSTDTFTLEHESSGLATEKNEKTSWLNPTYKGSMPWGVQARLGTRPNTPSPSVPSSDHESSTTTAFALAGSTASLEKQQQQSGLYLAPPLQRFATSSSLGMPGSIRSIQRALSSTDSLDLDDSPLIVPLDFPSPPAKPNHFVERYTASQVTPPCLRAATPEQTEAAEPMTPTLDTPATGRFQTSSKSYPSPVQAGFRTPSSRYSVETQVRREASGSGFAAARTLTFDGSHTPSSDTSAIGNRTRTNSFGGAAFPGSPLDASSPYSNRTQDTSRDAYRGQLRNFSYGLDVLEEPTHEASMSTGARGLDDQNLLPGLTRFRADANMSRWAQGDTPNETPNLSLSELVSSPPSTDTGIDDNIIHTAVITPEDRHFPTISSPPKAMAETWTPRGALGIGEGFGGGPQRDERGKKIDAKRWRLADPLTNDSPRTAVDVYTNDKPGKSRTKVGLKERFSQSVLNLLGDSKKGKARAAERESGEAGASQWPRKTTKAEKRKSVNDLLGPSVPRSTYAWEDPAGRSAQKETPGVRARRIFFGRSDRNLASRLRNPNSVELPAPRMVKSGSAFFPQPSHSASQPPPGTRKLPFSPSMPALSSSLNGRAASDIRIQTWLNTSQAALSDWEHARYNFTRTDAQRPPQVSPTPLRPYSFSKNAVSPTTGKQANGFSNAIPPSTSLPGPIADHPAKSSESPYRVLQPAPQPEEPAPKAAKEGRRRSILLGVAQRKNTTDVTAAEKQPKRRTTSINKLTSWLGFGRSKSSRILDQEIRYDGPALPPTPSSFLGSNVSQSTFAPTRPHYVNARTGSSTLLPNTDRQTEQAGNTNQRRRRSGGDWLGSIGRRRTDKQAHPVSSRSPEIILLSAEHLPPPTINEHGFLQSSAPLPFEPKLSETYLALHGIRTAGQSDHVNGQSSTGIPSMAIQMERDLSRLTEGDEDGVGLFSISPSPVISSAPTLATHSGHRRKPTPPFLDPWTTTSNSLAVPTFDMDKKRSKHIKRYPNTLSIGSMSSMSTGITDGEEPAIISAIRSSPIHEQLPSHTAPTVARGVSLDLSALTADERQAVGLGTTLHIPPIASTYPFPQAV